MAWSVAYKYSIIGYIIAMDRILVHVTIYRRLQIGRDDHLDQSKACNIS